MPKQIHLLVDAYVIYLPLRKALRVRSSPHQTLCATLLREFHIVTHRAQHATTLQTIKLGPALYLVRPRYLRAHREPGHLN